MSILLVVNIIMFRPHPAWISVREADKIRFFKKPKNRLRTFKYWPNRVVNSDDLVACGFFYTYQSDTVECYTCGILIKRWQLNDDVWLMHSKLSPYCQHVIAKKGLEFVKKACEDPISNTWFHSCIGSGTKPKNRHWPSWLYPPRHSCRCQMKMYDKMQPTCIVCGRFYPRCRFLPCGHNVTCLNCNKKIKVCPKCKSPVQFRLDAI